MNSIKVKYTFLILSIIFGCFSCQSEYTTLVKKELASDIKNDSIFLGLAFGQTKKDFFEICWNLNKKGLATHGPTNNYVQYILRPKDSSKILEKITMLFYPGFNPQKVITGMDIKFSYGAWSPWNKEFHADKLLPRVKDTLLKWYPGNDFMNVRDDILVKVDGNRQIEMKLISNRHISVKIEDLAYKYAVYKNKK